MAVGVTDISRPLSPEPIRRRHDRWSATRNQLAERRIDISHFKADLKARRVCRGRLYRNAQGFGHGASSIEGKPRNARIKLRIISGTMSEPEPQDSRVEVQRSIQVFHNQNYIVRRSQFHNALAVSLFATCRPMLSLLLVLGQASIHGSQR